MKGIGVAVLCGISACIWGCETRQFQTLKILDQRDRVVALQVVNDPYGGKGYDHPVSMTAEEMARLLQGVRVQRGFMSSVQHPAFSDTEIRVFAPYLVKALEQATPEEVVTFFETAQIDADNDLTTSGGLFIAGGNMYVVLSNFSVRTAAWRDADQYDAPFRHRPLEQMDPQPGRLVFEPAEYMVERPDAEIGSRLKGKAWQVAIRYKDFLRNTPPSEEQIENQDTGKP